MAIIKCPECGKQISDRATSCPGCGYPINEPVNATGVVSEDVIKCPICNSVNVHVSNQGFSTGKAVAGYLTIGALGALAGNIGRDKIKVTCLNCGKTFNPIEEMKKKQIQETDAELMNNSPVLGCLSYAMITLSIGLIFVSEIPFWVSLVLFAGGFVMMGLGLLKK